jgi:hypothetical protein
MSNRDDALYGESGPEGLRVCFSNDSLANILCATHEIGHLIVSINSPFAPIKASFKNQTCDKSKNLNIFERWYITYWGVDYSDALHIEELLSDICSLAVVKSCNMLDLAAVRSIWIREMPKVVWTFDPHTKPRTLVINFMDNHQTENIDWFKKAGDGIGLYYSKLGGSLDSFWKSLFVEA